MISKGTISIGVQPRRIEGLLLAVAVFLGVLVGEAALIRFLGPMDPPKLDPEVALIGL